MQAAPLILTIELDQVSHDYFTALRNQYFPKHCNYLEAHLTLFHNLPSDVLLIEEVLKKITVREPLQLEVTGLKNIGNGCVFTIASAELNALHKTMQHAFQKYLINQDRKKLWPHITIQNKVTAFKAAATTAALLKDFKPSTIQGTGIISWHYLKGPWQQQHIYHFNNAVNGAHNEVPA